MCNPKTNAPGITCAFCPATVPDVEAAIAQEWWPSYWDQTRDVEVYAPFCLDCGMRLMTWQDDFEEPTLRLDVEPPHAWRSAPNH